MIHLKTLKIRNFLSYGNIPTTIELDSNKKTLIMGDNGSGKSAIPQAICFVLFNKTYRNVNIPQLVNSINGKECLIELTFTIDNAVTYTVRRGIKPSLFEVEREGVLISSEKDFQKQFETTILKTDFNTFSSVIAIGGRDYRTFMTLKKSERRAIIENILDINIFSTMNIITKTLLIEKQTQQSQVKTKITLLKTELSLLNKIISDSSKDYEEIKTQQNKTLISLEEKIKELDVQYQELSKEINGLNNYSQILFYIEELQKKLHGFNSTLKTKPQFLDKIKKQTLFYQTNLLCPTCSQPIEEEFKNLKLLELEDQKLSKEKFYNQQEELLIELKIHLEELQESKRQTEVLLNKKQSIETEKKRLLVLSKELETNFQQNLLKTMDVTKYKEDLSLKTHLLEELEKEYQVYSEEIIYLEFCKELLKDDGIKTLIINEYLPIINKTINKFLDHLALDINFTFDEFLSEEIKSRYRDLFTYESFSDGQKLKIDLALLFTWREISSLKNSLQMNILFLDELFDSSLDLENTEIAIQTLNTFAKNNSVFIISHKTDLFSSSVDRILSCSLINNFTQITEVV